MPPRCKNPNAPAADDPGWLHYVEPYFGGGAVLLENDPEGISEVVNDLNRELTDFWISLQGHHFDEFRCKVEAIPFSQIEYEWARDAVGGNKIDAAVRFFVRCRQSLAGRMDSFAPLSKTRTRRGMNEQASAWLTAIEGLPAVHARLKRVVILNRDALDVIREQDGPRTLFYLDPPYTFGSRVTTGEYGPHEMSDDDHAMLLSVLAELAGRFLLSGYHSSLYDEASNRNGWNCTEIAIPNHASSKKSKPIKTECVWTNF